LIGCRARDGYVRHDGPEHVMGFAPTRSGKDVGLVVPTLLLWPGSAVVHAGATHGRLGEPEGSSWPYPILNDAAAFATSVAMPVDGGRVA